MNYTTIEQSKKLIELGLDKNCADMRYPKLPVDIPATYSTSICIGYNKETEDDLPAWSLEALLEMMPIIKKDIDEYLPYLIKGSEIWKGSRQAFWYCSYVLLDDGSTELTTFLSSIAIEAAYNMVIWLLENGYIKKGE